MWRGRNGAAKYGSNFGKGIEDGGTERERAGSVIGFGCLEQVKHVFSSLLEIVSCGDFGKRYFFREKIDGEDVTLLHCVGEVAFVAPVVLGRWSDVPTNLAVLAKSGASFSSNMGNDFCARRSKRNAIKIVVSK